MKSIRKSIVFICFLCLCFTSCKTEEPEPKPVEESQVYGEDFRVTIKTAQNWYKAEDFIKNARFILNLEYIGSKPEMKIYHPEQLAYIGIDTQDDKCVFDQIWELRQRTSVLKKGEPYQIELGADELSDILEELEKMGGAAFDNDEPDERYADNVFKNGSLVKGDYKAVAHIWFHTTEDVREGEEYQIKLPVSFEIR